MVSILSLPSEILRQICIQSILEGDASLRDVLDFKRESYRPNRAALCLVAAISSKIQYRPSISASHPVLGRFRDVVLPLLHASCSRMQRNITLAEDAHGNLSPWRTASNCLTQYALRTVRNLKSLCLCIHIEDTVKFREKYSNAALKYHTMPTDVWTWLENAYLPSLYSLKIEIKLSQEAGVSAVALRPRGVPDHFILHTLAVSKRSHWTNYEKIGDLIGRAPGLRIATISTGAVPFTELEFYYATEEGFKPIGQSDHLEINVTSLEMFKMWKQLYGEGIVSLGVKHSTGIPSPSARELLDVLYKTTVDDSLRPFTESIRSLTIHLYYAHYSDVNAVEVSKVLTGYSNLLRADIRPRVATRNKQLTDEDDFWEEFARALDFQPTCVVSVNPPNLFAKRIYGSRSIRRWD